MSNQIFCRMLFLVLQKDRPGNHRGNFRKEQRNSESPDTDVVSALIIAFNKNKGGERSMKDFVGINLENCSFFFENL